MTARRSDHRGCARRACRPARRRLSRGYALPLVIGALVLIMVVAGRFAARIDMLRSQAKTLQDYAQGRLLASNALSAALYLVATKGPGPVGFGEGAAMLRADDTRYSLPNGATMQVQDQRGLIPLNLPELRLLRSWLHQAGLGADAADTLIDGLLDYTDSDDLHRLNGAEAPAYAERSLPPPRNDWLLSPQELGQVLAWRDRQDLIEQLQPWLSLQREAVFNPLTAPMPLLALWFGEAAAPQLQLFDTLRHAPVAPAAAAAQALTGLPMVDDYIGFYVSDMIGITVWAPGLPRVRQYNLQLLPAGIHAPWMVLQVRARAGSEQRNDQPPSTAFPFSTGAYQP